MNEFRTYGILAVVLLTLELLYFRIADSFNIIDKPNERSSHSTIVLRDSADDQSQRMLNALEPGTVLPIHRHRTTSETVVILRGRAVQYLYDDAGNETGHVLLVAGAGDPNVASLLGLPEDAVPGMQVEKGQWHRLESLESGTVIVEFKDGTYVPIGEGDVLSM